MQREQLFLGSHYSKNEPETENIFFYFSFFSKPYHSYDYIMKMDLK